MKSKSPLTPGRELSRRIRIAAKCRADGIAWSAIAQKLRVRRASTCELWATRYADLWAMEYEAAWEEARRAADVEALALLRSLLRDKDLKLRQTAAAQLLNRRRLELPPDSARQLDPFDGLTDAALAAIALGRDAPPTDDAQRPADASGETSPE